MHMQELWQQWIHTYPFLQITWDALRIIIPLACLLAYAGIVFISATAKIIFISRSRSSFNKCSRQIGLLALILGWVLLAGSRVWLYLNPHTPGTLENFLMEMSWLLLSLGVLLTTVYYTFWKILVNMPVLHVTLGMISGAQNCIALVCTLFTIRLSAGISNLNAETLKLPDLFPQVWNDPIWSAAAFTLPLIFAYAGAFSVCWLTFRRKHDDFGRDYYNIMIPWSAKWARNCWCILWILFIAASIIQINLVHQDQNLFEEDLIVEGIRALLWLIPLLLWTIAIKSKIPMRHKWGLLFALLIAISFMLPYFLDITLV